MGLGNKIFIHIYPYFYCYLTCWMDLLDEEVYIFSVWHSAVFLIAAVQKNSYKKYSKS